MPAEIGPRFVLEAGFLILLAVVAGIAELSAGLIVLVMAVGWLLVALIEYFAWRQSPAFATVERYAVAEVVPAAPVAQEMVEDPPPPPPPTPPPAPPEPDAAPPDTAPPATPEPDTPPPAEEETIVGPAPTEPVGAEEVIDFRPEHEINYRLDPLKPRPSRRWVIFGPRVRREDDREEER